MILFVPPSMTMQPRPSWAGGCGSLVDAVADSAAAAAVCFSASAEATLFAWQTRSAARIQMCSFVFISLIHVGFVQVHCSVRFNYPTNNAQFRPKTYQPTAE